MSHAVGGGAEAGGEGGSGERGDQGGGEGGEEGGEEGGRGGLRREGGGDFMVAGAMSAGDVMKTRSMRSGLK